MLKRVGALTGLGPVKRELTTLFAVAENQRERAEAGLPVEQQSMHLVFEGNPGTGKTTVAKEIGRAYHALGLLEKPTITQISRTDLVGQYVGQSGPKTRKAFDKAKGGVLFIDEAYDLVKSPSDDYGQEALTELMQLAEENRSNTVVIMAGYTKEMDKMLSANPGAKSRFPTRIPFPDYSSTERRTIARNQFKRQGYVMDRRAEKALANAVGSLPSGPGAGNARDIRNLYDATRRAQAVRLAQRKTPKTKQHLQRITAADVHAGLAAVK